MVLWCCGFVAGRGGTSFCVLGLGLEVLWSVWIWGMKGRGEVRERRDWGLGIGEGWDGMGWERTWVA